MNKIQDLVYDTISHSQKLDLYLPDNVTGKMPLMVFIHGGAWFECDKSDYQKDAWLNLVDAGYAVASINYRLAGEAIHPAGIIDCKTAIRYLKSKADKYSIDKTRVAVSGGSSGGHYALMVGVTMGNVNFEDMTRGYSDENSNVNAVVALYAGIDINEIYKDSISGRWGVEGGAKFAIENIERYLGKKITDPDDEAMKLCSVTHYVSENMPPILLQHGDQDELCPVEQSKIFYKLAKPYLRDDIEIDIIHGERHGHEGDYFSTSENMNRILKFLNSHI